MDLRTFMFGMEEMKHSWGSRISLSRNHQPLDGALEHGTWTLGQTIPYLRLNGIEPPAYAVFPDPE